MWIIQILDLAQNSSLGVNVLSCVCEDGSVSRSEHRRPLSNPKTKEDYSKLLEMIITKSTDGWSKFIASVRLLGKFRIQPKSTNLESMDACSLRYQHTPKSFRRFRRTIIMFRHFQVELRTPLISFKNIPWKKVDFKQSYGRKVVISINNILLIAVNCQQVVTIN